MCFVFHTVSGILNKTPARVFINQVQFSYIAPKSQITKLLQGALKCVQYITSSIFSLSFKIRKTTPPTPKKTTFDFIYSLIL